MAHKQYNTLLKLMQTGYNRPLAREICEFCRRNKSDPHKEFIYELGGAAKAAWTTQGAEDFIVDYMLQLEQADDEWDSDNTLAQRDAALALMDKYFILTAENGSSVYRVVDGTNMIVEPCCANNLSPQVGQVIKHELAHRGKAADKALIGRILDLYQHNGAVQPKPKLWAQPDDPVWCLARAMMRPDAAVPFPHIQALLDRLNDPEAFAAYLHGVYSGRNKGRQCLYLSEEIGESGKSSFLRHFQRLFGDEITAALNWNLLNTSSHASAHFAGKKFVVIGDNKNPNLLMTQAVKELSGDDKVMVNQKYEAVYSTYMECRIVVLSNMPPNITSERHNQSRTLWISMSPLTVPVDPTWSDHYDDEMPGFLAYAERCYTQRCPTDYEIEVNELVKEAVALRVVEYESEFVLTFDRLYARDPAGKLSLEDFKSDMDALKWNPHERSNFLLWVSRMFFHGDLKKEHGNKGTFYRGIRAKTSRDRKAASEMMAGLDDDDDAPYNARKGGAQQYDA